MGSDKDIYKLLGTLTEEGDVLPFPDWDVLKELDRREKRKSFPRKEANRRAHRSPLRREAGNKYHRDVITPRKSATRAWMREHPEVVDEIKTRRM